MKIRAVLSRRQYKTWRSWHLVYEWEDVIREKLNIPLLPYFDEFLYRKYGKYYKRIPIQLVWCIPSLVFEMLPMKRKTPHFNNRFVVPCIIDWYLKTDDELNAFYERYSKNKLVIVTSKQVFKYLSTIETPIRFGHLPLSLPDKYRITPEMRFDKDLDVVLMGRQNPVLLQWLYQYRETHPGLKIVTSKREADNYDYYTLEGEFIANATSREQCMNLMKRSRVSLYSTKAIDDDYTDYNTNGFNQVTPRFFECLATGNHVIARYKENEDTDYFEVKSVCPNTDSYESFEEQMDYALSHPVDMKFYSEYLEKHYTSTRVELLRELLNSV